MAVTADVTYVLANAQAAYTLLKAEASYQKISAVEILLDADSLNRYFGSHEFAMVDNASLAYIKTLSDSIGLSESVSVTTGKQIADNISLGETVSVLMVFEREFTDSLGLTDSTTLSTEIAKVDGFDFLDQIVLESIRGVSSPVSISDSMAYSLSIESLDSIALSDAPSISTAYIRSFADAFALDDSYNGGLIYTENKSNVFGMNDSFSYTLALGNNAVLNTSAINTFTLNR